MQVTRNSTDGVLALKIATLSIDESTSQHVFTLALTHYIRRPPTAFRHLGLRSLCRPTALNSAHKHSDPPPIFYIVYSCFYNKHLQLLYFTLHIMYSLIYLLWFFKRSSPSSVMSFYICCTSSTCWSIVVTKRRFAISIQTCLWRLGGRKLWPFAMVTLH